MAISKAFAFAIALTFAHSSFASTLHSHSNLDINRHRRQTTVPTIPTKLPGNWTFEGCYTDNVGSRTLNGNSFTNATGMTIEQCINFCAEGNWVLAGVEFATQVYCDNFIQNNATINAASACNMACVGNDAELCGGPSLLDIFNSGQKPPPPPEVVPKVGNWTSLGCYSDGVNGQRTLSVQMDLTSNTVEACTSSCFTSGYQFSGVEFADQCFCASSILNGAPIPAADCNMVCSGNATEFCGGPDALNMYNYTGNNLPPISNPGGGGGGAPTGAPVFPVTSGLPKNWAYVSCYVDNAFGRIFEFMDANTTGTTIESCIDYCISPEFHCCRYRIRGPVLLVNGAVTTTSSACDMGCAGNATEACGGPNALSVYSSSPNVTALPVPTVQKSPGENWTYAGCYTDSLNTVRTLPWELQLTLNNSAETCTSTCSAFGYTAAGMEFGIQCFCGDISDIAANGGTLAPETDCNTQCSGNPIEICGAGNRLTMYTWEGTKNVWHTPANTGYYEFFVPGVVVPLIATLGINNKVTFLEKWGTSEFDNSTGAYELDLSLSNDFDLMWRAMHVQTDVFCSGSVILPDIGGRIINVGGWSLTSTFGVRLYQPDGSPGVNGTNDWEENADELHLLSGRWYPGALVLSNGSVLVMGGESGSNAGPVPSLEILPLPEGVTSTVFLDFLNRTDPYNLYPFLTMLPSGRVFTAYYNEARILDPVTFETVVNASQYAWIFLAGRTYPLEGSMIPFPQHAPYTDPFTVLICGGSTPGAAQVLDNCVSISPEVENATWTLERMPSVRVMTCMVPLPDGTMMIMNGAMEGVAGFGLASNPNLNAVLYDPTQPIGERFSILNNTIVARMYHSEAILLPDGRILVSGSDPQTPGFPEEMRIEVYVPPYLNQGITQPTYNISKTDFGYNQQFTITNVKVFHGAVSSIKVSMVAAVSSTHGNAMGARTIFPAFSISGTTVTITTPPNSFVSPPGWWQLFILDDAGTPSHSTWIRVGGDPAQVGLWPDLPGFTTPGL
ncbi:galactose oxidase [Gymnopus androsaceus JB14]|uniref:Galactose oxidase n=1 Tax=Gymnopus androsaceus JB14 TaxID=1447944 RepID=A0A6A4GTD3_9AGAR|nr:galactose oxidase [Gymnopus androsaceus JB14]